MWCCNDVHAVMTYGTSAYYKAAPSAEQRATGVVPLDSLPAAWWNCMWCDTNSAINEARDAIGSFIDEVNTLLTNANIQPNCNCVDTIYRAINKIRQTIGDASVAGAVKSSSCPGEVSIDVNGIMTANCVGNASSLTTTARTVVGAVNELKCTYDCCISDINSTMGGKAPTSHASSATTYGVGTASDYGHLKISDTYATLVGCACDGIAASQKAVNDLYQLIPQGSSVNWTDPNCTCGYMVVRYGTDLGYVPGICSCYYCSSSSCRTTLCVGILGGTGTNYGELIVRGRHCNPTDTCLVYTHTCISRGHVCRCYRGCDYVERTEMSIQKVGGGASKCAVGACGSTANITLTINRDSIYGGSEAVGCEIPVNYYAGCTCVMIATFPTLLGDRYSANWYICNNTELDIYFKCVLTCRGACSSGWGRAVSVLKIGSGGLFCIGAGTLTGAYVCGEVYSECSGFAYCYCDPTYCAISVNTGYTVVPHIQLAKC